MKITFLMGILSCSLLSVAQTKVDKTIPLKPGQKLEMNLDYPAVTLQTWDKNEIHITGTVSINHGENDNSFDMKIETENNAVRVTTMLKDKESIPRRLVIKKDEKEYYFKAKDVNDPEVQKFLEQNGREYSYMSFGINQDIKLEVFVPKNLSTAIVAKYGLVEVKNFEAPLTIDSKYGGVDATLTARLAGEVVARTCYGEILTNLDVKFDQTSPLTRHDKWTEIKSKLGAGPNSSFESKYGNIYLRKAN